MSSEKIYQTYKDIVYNLALQYVQNQEDAQEIAQDVFVAIHQSISEFRQQSNVTTWIYRITINHSLNFLKAKKRKKRFTSLTTLFFPNSNEPLYEVAHFDHPGAVLESKESLMTIFQYINQLPDNQKTALILLKIEQKSQTEVAEIMNISVKAVESILQRAKNNLAKNLQNL